MRTLSLTFCLTLLCSGATLLAEEDRAPIRFNESDMEWKAGPGSIPPGGKFVLLEGNPATTEIFTMRVILPPDYLLPIHWHEGDERVTVLGGSVDIGLGESMESAEVTTFRKGGYYVTPPPTRHFVRAGAEGAVLQLTGLGPWTIEYVDPNDDPRKK